MGIERCGKVYFKISKRAKNWSGLALSVSKSASINEGSEGGKIRNRLEKCFAAPDTGGRDPAHCGIAREDASGERRETNG
jgi:hypothetical protein